METFIQQEWEYWAHCHQINCLKNYRETKNWQQDDTLTPVQPALHHIAVTAQRSPGASHKYRLRMPFHQIDRALEIAKKIEALVFLDIQVGHSTLKEEISALKKYLLTPPVHLGIDPEYSMKGGEVPCSIVGTFDASDINYSSEYLSRLVREHNLPPKILVVHRFTQNMENLSGSTTCGEHGWIWISC